MVPAAVASPVSRLAAALAESRQRIDAALDDCTRFGPGCPPVLADAIRYCLLAPGKRLRPTLVLWSAAACGCHDETALPAACAVEMIHTYSLVHDDLPAMDDDDLRRGRPTCHKVYGEANAILVGDALLALAFEVLARGTRPPETAVACVAALAEAAGVTALVGGQFDDLAGAGGNMGATAGLPSSGSPRAMLYDSLLDKPAVAPGDAGTGFGETRQRLAALEAIHRRKTGAMFLVSLRLGGLVAGADPRQLAALEEYGRRLGLAFQIADDLLDVEGEETALGKRVGKDSGRGKLTFPGLLGAAESRRYASQLIDEACSALSHVEGEPFGPAGELLAALARFVLERNR